MKISKFLLVIIIVVLVLGTGAAGYYMASKNAASSSQANTTAKEYLFNTGEITANLTNNSGRSYIKINIYLGYDSKKLGTELTDKTTQIQDAMIDILRSKKASDISSEQGVEKMKSEIITRTNSVLTTGKITKVYFSEMLIQ